MNPTRPSCLRRYLRRAGRWPIAAAAAAMAALALGPAPARAANDWMDPTLVVAVTRFPVDASDLAFLGLGPGNPATLVDQLGPRQIYLLKPANGQSAGDMINKLERSTSVLALHVGRNRRVTSLESSGLIDAFGAIKNSVNAIGEVQATKLGLPIGWTDPWLKQADVAFHSSGAGLTVAVLDTGVDLTHPWFFRRLTVSRVQASDMVGRDFSPAEDRLSTLAAGKAWGHGTHVAGTVAQVAPGARILPVRVLDANGRGTLWTVARGTAYALDPDDNPKTFDGARVLNMSFGASGLTPGEDGALRTLMKLATCHADLRTKVPPFDQPGYLADHRRCFDRLNPQRTVVVAGEGNDVRAAPLVPAAYSAALPALIAVTASDPRGARADFASRGASQEVVAPGELITSAFPSGDPRGDWAIMSGTSMAAPWVSGVAALLMAMTPPTSPTTGLSFWTGEAVRQRIRSTAAQVCGRPGLELAPLRAVTDDTSFASACR